MIFALLLGGQLYGFIEAFIALPIAACLRETWDYQRQNLAFEGWDLPNAAEPVPDAPPGLAGRVRSVAERAATAPSARPAAPARRARRGLPPSTAPG